MIGESAGFTLRYVGLLWSVVGRKPLAALIAASTSRAAASMFRLKSNCNVTFVWPKLLDEVISVTPAIRPNCRSRGVATEDAMISGLAPAMAACTETVGKSTCGNGETGSNRNATAPANATAAVRRVVATGFLMNGEERLTLVAHRRGRLETALRTRPVPEGRKLPGDLVEEQINDGGRVERENLAHNQSADDGDTQWPPQLCACALP